MADAVHGRPIAHTDIASARAVSAIRRAFHPATGCATAPRSWPSFIENLGEVAASFREAHARMIEAQGSGLMIALPGTLRPTRHESRLLRATAAAQADDDQLVDNYLFKLAPGRATRLHLARAVIVLATNLAIAGHWLQRPAIPAAALLIARLQGIDLHARSIAWPPATRNSERS